MGKRNNAPENGKVHAEEQKQHGADKYDEFNGQNFNPCIYLLTLLNYESI